MARDFSAAGVPKPIINEDGSVSVGLNTAMALIARTLPSYLVSGGMYRIGAFKGAKTAKAGAIGSNAVLVGGSSASEARETALRGGASEEDADAAARRANFLGGLLGIATGQLAYGKSPGAATAARGKRGIGRRVLDWSVQSGAFPGALREAGQEAIEEIGQLMVVGETTGLEFTGRDYAESALAGALGGAGTSALTTAGTSSIEGAVNYGKKMWGFGTPKADAEAAKAAKDAAGGDPAKERGIKILQAFHRKFPGALGIGWGRTGEALRSLGQRWTPEGRRQSFLAEAVEERNRMLQSGALGGFEGGAEGELQRFRKEAEFYLAAAAAAQKEGIETTEWMYKNYAEKELPDFVSDAAGVDRREKLKQLAARADSLERQSRAHRFIKWGRAVKGIMDEWAAGRSPKFGPYAAEELGGGITKEEAEQQAAAQQAADDEAKKQAAAVAAEEKQAAEAKAAADKQAADDKAAADKQAAADKEAEEQRAADQKAADDAEAARVADEKKAAAAETKPPPLVPPKEDSKPPPGLADSSTAADEGGDTAASPPVADDLDGQFEAALRDFEKDRQGRPQSEFVDDVAADFIAYRTATGEKN